MDGDWLQVLIVELFAGKFTLMIDRLLKISYDKYYGTSFMTYHLVLCTHFWSILYKYNNFLVAEIQIFVSKTLLQQGISSISFVNMDGDWLQILIVELFAGVAVHQSHQELRLPGRKQGPKI